MAIKEFSNIKEERLEQELIDLKEHIDDLEGIFLDYGFEEDANLLIKKYNEYLDLLPNSWVPDERKSMRISARIHLTEKFLGKYGEKRDEFRGYLQTAWKSAA